MTNKPLLFAAALAALAVFTPPAALAQLGTRQEERAFDYDPGAEAEGKVAAAAAETTYEDADIVEHPIYGTIIISKHRWKNWVARALYLSLINVALLVIILSLSRNYEYSIIVGYILSGMSAALSLWTLLCAILIFQLGAPHWLYIAPAALVTAAVGHVVLMKIKRSDVSLTELKESFKQMSAAAHEDPRLVSVNGAPGDWPTEDFIKPQ